MKRDERLPKRLSCVDCVH